MPLDNKLSNIIGTKLPTWVLYQLETRANKNTQDSRDNDNILYLANKSAWVRLVSSVNIGTDDLNYFKRLIGDETIQDQTSLAKHFILFAGTSKYLNKNSYGLRSGLNKDGAYGILGNAEVQQFGYRPMPGINSVTIETQGRLGSVRAATINFKCWDKDQLDIIDALYFKLGFTMFLEWGHTYFYPSPENTQRRDPNKIISTELYTIDPFEDNLNKEDIQIKIAKNSRETEGNYDGMLGIVTNFNFTYNQEGGYDCTLRLMGLGVLGDAIKINNSGTLPAILKEEILELNNTLIEISKSVNVANGSTSDTNKKSKYPICVRDIGEIQTPPQKRNNKDRLGPEAILGTVNNVSYYFYPDGQYQTSGFGASGKYECKNNALYIDAKPADPSNFTYEEVLADNKEKITGTRTGTRGGKGTFLSNVGGINYFGFDQFKVLMPQDVDDYKVTVKLDIPRLSDERGTYDSGDGVIKTIVETITEADKFKKLINGKLVPIKEGDQITYKDNLALVLRSKATFDSIDEAGTGVTFTGQVLDFLSDSFKFITTLGLSGNPEPYSAGIFYKTKFAFGEISLLYSNLTKYLNDPVLNQIMQTSNRDVASADIQIAISGIRRVPTNGKDIQKLIKDTISSNQTEWNVKRFSDGLFELVYTIKIPRTIPSYVKNSTGVYEQKGVRIIDYELEIKLIVTDLDLISEVKIAPNSNLITPKTQELSAQNVQETTPEEPQKFDLEALDTQLKQSLNYQSTLEIMLRTIQVHALNKAINKTKKPDLEIGRTTYVLDIFDRNDKRGDKTFLNQIFSTGIFSQFIDRLVDGTINDYEYSIEQKMVPETRFKIHSKYGFATSLMGNKEPISSMQAVNFKELLKAYVVPYQINQEIVKGTYTNHPVYIPLGLILMILNHSCTIYDTNNDFDFQTPLVYVDFNPEMNFCLTNTKQLSTDPWTCLIPFEGSDDDYQKLFDSDILINSGSAIKPTSGSTESIKLFKPNTEDYLSGTLPKLKFDTQPKSVVESKYFSAPLASFISTKQLEESGNIYRGKMMNILLNIDYLVQSVQDFSYKDGTNSVYLKSFIEKILSDINKSLGNFNAFRLSYNDSANTFQIVDDQFVPSLSNEQQITPKSNNTELPLLGKFSIAKNLEIRSEISSRLSNMLAISANANSQNKATLSTNGDSFGFVNTAYSDRYITNRLEVTGSGNDKSNNDTLKISAGQFNSAISDFYSKINPSQTSVAHATNYYMEKMSIVKNNEFATRASAMIPVSVNFTTDGISGMGMGQAFTVPDKLLPYTYTTRKIPGAPQDHINNVGFVMVGLTHNIENNQWNTAVKANMIYLKDKTEFSGSITKVDTRTGIFGVNTTNDFTTSTIQTNFVAAGKDAKKAAEVYLNRTMTDIEWSELVSATAAEASDDQTEEANVMGVILNRVRTNYGGYGTTVGSQLRASNQFESVTGRDPSNFISGPRSRATSIYGAAVNILVGVPKGYLYFTSANKSLFYDSNGKKIEGRDTKNFDNAVKNYKLIGGSYFG
jgi:hypothetical protein